MSRSNGECVYCGQMGRLTSDHVIPRCVFPKPRPQDMLTVRACNDCNNQKSNHDDFLRDLLVTDLFGAESEPAKKLFDKVQRSFGRDQSLMQRTMENSKIVDVPMPDGESISADAAKFGLDRANEMLTFIVKGLYFNVVGSRLPPESIFNFSRLLPTDMFENLKRIEELKPSRFLIGDGAVFDCIYVTGRDGISLWILQFFGSVWFRIMTGPPGLKMPRNKRPPWET
ncbi:MAG: hypothetical protein AAFN77_20735 [Planctomycetota bacterium]